MRKTDIFFLNNDNIELVARTVAKSLLNRAICIIPTDTIYGIIAIESFKAEVNEIYRIRERPLDKPLIRLVGNSSSLKDFTDQSLPDKLKDAWPGPLTIVFKAKNDDKIAVRWPKDLFLDMVFKEIDYRSIVAPSANKSGEEDIWDYQTIIDTFRGKVDKIVCLKYGLRNRKPSTIIDISEPKWKILREGVIKINL